MTRGGGTITAWHNCEMCGDEFKTMRATTCVACRAKQYTKRKKVKNK